MSSEGLEEILKKAVEDREDKVVVKSEQNLRYQPSCPGGLYIKEICEKRKREGKFVKEGRKREPGEKGKEKNIIPRKVLMPGRKLVVRNEVARI